MIVGTMGKVMEKLAPSSIHVLEPGQPSKAVGLARGVYDQMRRDFMVASPFVLHAELPELLAASWVLVRETLFCGEVDRGRKELVAQAVSQANQCPFCVDAHNAAVRAAGLQDSALERWAAATAHADNNDLARPPFDEMHAAEYLGTAVAFHYLNRMVSVFLDDTMMPVPRFMYAGMPPMAKLMMGGMISKGRANRPGDSLEFLDGASSEHAWTPDWAAGSSSVSAALSGFSSLVEQAAHEHVSTQLRRVLEEIIERWNGETDVASFIDSATAVLDAPDHAAARLALMTVMTPSRVDDKLLRNVAGENDLAGRQMTLALVSWSAQRASRRCATWSSSSWSFA